MSNKELIDRLAATGGLSVDEFEELVSTYTADDRDYATSRAYKATRDRFGPVLYPWGVVAISTFCSKECFYCGLCRGAEPLPPFRLDPAEIVERCQAGYDLGCRSLVLESSYDPELTDDYAEELIWKVKKRFSDCALVLSFGERSRETYERYFNAGADRYLLRHETADAELFAKLHPRRVNLANRVRCLEDLQSVGFQTGCGMLVGLPFADNRTLARDLAFMADFKPAVASIFPFQPSHTLRFTDASPGQIGITLFVISLVRLALPDALIPASRSLAAVHPRGREMAVMGGANVLFANLTPQTVRAQYASDCAEIGCPEIGEKLAKLTQRMDAIGYRMAAERGDYKPGGSATHDGKHAKRPTA